MNPPSIKARLTLTRVGTVTLLVLALATPWKASSPAVAADQAADSPAATGCLPAGNGYLRARIRGAMNLDVDWRNAELECDGGARPDGNGIRLSFAGPVQADGRRLRMVFGVSKASEGQAGSALPTNLTVIVEDEGQLYTTQGDERCAVEDLVRTPLDGELEKVAARGYCLGPASDLAGQMRLLVPTFSFAVRTRRSR